ncbi:MAG: acyl-ACP--UDP-N-acetylglucosamine O-acyltransferase [Methylococcales bacterium]|nr:acyl-ACP--UDP-N-acetylglucosamine O-acyltransferase [Methylococcales bacterium]
MAQNIHSTACIAPTSILADNVKIGPFVVIEDYVELGENCELGAHSVVQSYVKMGKGNILHPHTVLGGLPQDTSFKKETISWLKIGDNNVFREGVTAHRSSVEDGTTFIESDCYFMNNSHVAHDCHVGNNTIFANNVAIGGYVEVGNNVFIGGGTVIHQFCRIGSYAIIQGAIGVNMDVLPFMLVGGTPIKHYRLNAVGLKRAGIKGERYKALSSAIKLLKNKKSLDSLKNTEELEYLKQWLESKSKRGVHGFINTSQKNNE